MAGVSMDGLGRRIRGWATTPARRVIAVLVGAGSVAWAGWALLEFRSASDRGDDAHLAATFTVALLLVAFGVDRSIVLTRAFARPCRRSVEISNLWVAGPVVTLCLVAFGLLGILDGDPSTPLGIGAAMLGVGLGSLLMVSVWFRKPICGGSDKDP